MPSLCKCEEAWTVPECSNTEQNGCVNCDDDVGGSWCMVKNAACIDVERNENLVSEGWRYCDGNFKLSHVFAICSGKKKKISAKAKR